MPEMLLTILGLLAAALVCVALLSTHSTLRYAARYLFTRREGSECLPPAPDDVAAVDYFSAVLEASGGARLIAGSKITLLNDGPETFAAMLAAIEQARNHVNFETYTLGDGEVGQRFATALIRKAAAGVQVNLLYDAVGSLGIDNDFLRQLRDAGITVKAFQTIMDLRLWRFNQRDHRKILVVDGSIGFIGGVNISADYLDQSVPAAGAEISREDKGWRDIHTRIEGPVVAELQRTFLHTWLNAGCRTDANVRYFPDIMPAGAMCAAIIVADRLDVESRILDSQIAAVQIAKQKVWITQAYFVPHLEFVDALAASARRGVDVRILLPGFTDSALVLHASHAHFAALLQAGVKLFQYQPALLHAKAMVVDGIWATVGSSNIDLRSLELNNEANVVVVDAAFAAAMEQLFVTDQAHSKQVVPAEWASRSLWLRLAERCALLLKYWL